VDALLSAVLLLSLVVSKLPSSGASAVCIPLAPGLKLISRLGELVVEDRLFVSTVSASSSSSSSESAPTLSAWVTGGWDSGGENSISFSSTSSLDCGSLLLPPSSSSSSSFSSSSANSESNISNAS